MDDTEFDRALIAAALSQIADTGWRRLDLAAAARAGGLDLARARGRFPGRCTLLCRFNRLVDQAALEGAPADGPVRDRLFDMLMRRIDALQAHRAGVLALLRGLPLDPQAALTLGAASLRGMAWMLRAAGASAAPPLGPLRAKALLAVWLWTLRAWQRDSSEDLSATMAALDHALSRAERAETWLYRRPQAGPPPDPIAEAAAPEPQQTPPQADPDAPG
jgi:hypothetical protein